MKYDVIVIGGGVNGLTAAAYLARAGRKVVVVERRGATGGLCATEEFHPGFRANSCVDDPGWVPPSMIRELGLESAGYAQSFAPVSMTIPVDGERPIVITPDMRATADAIRLHSQRDAVKWPEFCAFVARMCGFMEALYDVRPPAVESNAPGDLLSLLSLGRRLRALGRRGMIDVIRTMPMPIADLLDEWFESDVLKGALSTIGVRNVQHGPQSGGTALVFLHNHVGVPVGHVGGQRVARGGVGALATSLAKIVKQAGGEVRTSADVSSILLRDDRAAGVVLAGGEQLDAPIVLSSTDPRHTLSLCDAGDFDPEFLHGIDCVRMRGPQVRVHLALDRLPTFVSGRTQWTNPMVRGSMTIAPTMSYVERAYDAAKHGRAADAPWLSVSMPSIDDPSFAPAGKHVMSVQAQYAPFALRDGWTSARRVAIGEQVTRLLGALSPDLQGTILHREVIAPPDIEARYGATEGSLLHGELTLDQYLFARPVAASSRYALPVDGLWMCGSGTHPGAGTAGASGRLAAREILSRRH